MWVVERETRVFEDSDPFWHAIAWFSCRDDAEEFVVEMGISRGNVRIVSDDARKERG